MYNLVVITSVINNFLYSVYNPEQRLEQTIDSINSIYNKIPNPYVVLLEGSELSNIQNQILKNKVNEIYKINISGLHKSLGELTLLKTYFNSEQFISIKSKINSFSKLSGRYILNNNFKFVDNDLCMVKKTDISWLGKGTYDTRFYKIPINLLENYIIGLESLYKNINNVHDIEHGFFEYQLIPKDKINLLSKLGVSGNYAPTGEYVED
jgi:hypothetical protein